jgi:hypothetical protein
MKSDQFIKARTFIEKAESSRTVLAVLTQFSRELAYQESIALFDLAIERLDYILQKQISLYERKDDLLPFQK